MQSYGKIVSNEVGSLLNFFYCCQLMGSEIVALLGCVVDITPPPLNIKLSRVFIFISVLCLMLTDWRSECD